MSRDINDLAPIVKVKCEKLIELCAKQGIEIIVTSTLRTMEEQSNLYKQGRQKAGKIVTNAKPGYSYHNFGLAFDCVPIKNGKAIWNDDRLWQRVGEIGKSVGLTWGGDFKFIDKPHFEYNAGATLAELRQKANIA